MCYAFNVFPNKNQIGVLTKAVVNLNDIVLTFSTNSA